MKIIIANPYLSLTMGGGAVLPRQMAHCLSQLGIDVTLIGLSLEPCGDKTRPFRTEVEGIPAHMVPAENFLKYGHYPNYSLLRPDEALKEVFAGILDESGVDLVHCVSLIGLGPLVEAAFDRSIPCVYTAIDLGAVCLNQVQLNHDGIRYRLNENGTRCSGPDASKCLACQRKKFSWPLFFLGTIIRHTTMRGWGRVFDSSHVRLAENLARFPLSNYLHPKVADAREYMQRVLHLLSRCIAPAPAAREALIKSGFPGERILDIVYGIVDKALTKRKKTSGVALRDRPLLIGFFGSVAYHKGIHVLIDAFCQIPSKNSVRLILCVSGGDSVEDVLSNVQDKRTAKQLIASKKIQIHWNCPNDEFFERMAKVDISIIPTLCYECCPLVLLETLAQGTPCIVSEGPGMNHIVKHSISGDCFPVGSVAGIREKLMGLLKDPEQISQWSENIFVPYSNIEYARRLSDTYQNLLMTPRLRNMP